MHNVIFFTCHRQLDEIQYASQFFNRSDYLKNNFEVILHCNNPKYSLDQLKEKSKFETKTDIILTSKNSGYNFGAFEALSDNFELLKRYNTVIHTHPDCYITDSSKLELVMCNIEDFAVSPFHHIHRDCYSSDFFIFKPKINYFKDWNIAKTHVAEHWLYDTIKDLNLKICHIDRFVEGIPGKSIDNFGIWHNHNILQIIDHLK